MAVRPMQEETPKLDCKVQTAPAGDANSNPLVRGSIMITGSRVGPTVVETGMRAEDVLANEVAEYSSHDRICGEVLQTSHACGRNRGGRAVSKKLHPGLRIFVCQHACHRPGQAGML